LVIKSFLVGGIGTNCYLVWDEASKDAMLIDPGDFEISIEQVIAENNLFLKYIFLTHGHFDDIGGVDGFQELEPDILLVSHEADDNMLRSIKPDMHLKDGDVLTLGELPFVVYETPGHTPGGLCLFTHGTDNGFAKGQFAGTLFSGDTLFHMSVGRTDLQGGDFEILLNSIHEKLFTLHDDVLVLPGHMGATTIGNEKKYNPFVK
jgi:glyoxylase-like metal-dependent hydrolase (beta-lactamase superfamily II)